MFNMNRIVRSLPRRVFARLPDPYNCRRDDLENPPWLGICGKHSREPLERGVPIGDWYLSWQSSVPGFDPVKIEPIGTHIVAQVISSGFRAVNFEEGYISRDPGSEAYGKVRRMEHDVPSKGIEGMEALVYLPRLNVFAIYFAGSRSAKKFLQGDWNVHPPAKGSLDFNTAQVWEARKVQTRGPQQTHEWYCPVLAYKGYRRYRPVGKLRVVEKFHSKPMFELFHIQASPLAKRLYATVEETAGQLRQLGYDEASVLTVGINALDRMRRPLV